MTVTRDADGIAVPTDTDLDLIAQWPWERCADCFAFVKRRWWMPDWGWRERAGVYRISTGGWSGNEQLIGALQENTMVWLLTWWSSRRGGHYTFRLPESQGGLR